MNKNYANVTLALLAILLLLALNIQAQAPDVMVYQGRLADIDGNPITGAVDVNFAIYLDAAADPNDSIWSETIQLTPDEQGVFTAELGASVPLTTAIFDGAPKFLGIKVNTDAQMTPFQLLASAPYAINANVGVQSIFNTQINNSAAILASKISGTAATLSASQRFLGTNYYGDSSIIINNFGIRVGDGTVPSASSFSLLRIDREYNHSGSFEYGVNTRLTAKGTGGLVGVYGVVSTSGASPGVMYGVYGGASGGSTNYAGYFSGNVHVTGSLSKAAGSFKIDHPTDPTNKYLYHSFVESPDMMNVYNGNITTDANGTAVVELPDYFKALNKDFRYQLTVIGEFAQAIIGEEIQNNQFTIRTDKPLVKVSWQITGIRKDAFAEANRIKVEVEKPAAEKGLYLHPKAFKLGPEMQIHHNLFPNDPETTGDGHE